MVSTALCSLGPPNPRNEAAGHAAGVRATDASWILSEPRKKGPLVGWVIEGIMSLPQLDGDYFIKHEIRIPIKQPV